MQVTELTKKIQDEYPKTYRGILINYHRYIQEASSYPFFLLYAVFEDFFEENGITITIYITWINEKSEIGFSYTIYNNKKLLWDDWKEFDGLLYTKEIAKQQAILKTCEILENK